MILPLHLERPLVVLDAETTGLDAEEARIVELGLIVFYPSGSCSGCIGEGVTPTDDVDVPCVKCGGTKNEPNLEWRTLVNPMVPIPPMSTETHGIADAMVQACQVCGLLGPQHSMGSQFDAAVPIVVTDHNFKPWPRFAQLAGRLARFLTGVDFAGKHVRYDLRVMAKEMRRNGVDSWSYAGASIVDADRNEQIMEPRDLSSLYRRRCAKEPVNAHSALTDCQMTTELIAAQLALWPTLPRTPAELHALQWADWIDAEGKFRFDKLNRPIVRFGKHDGKAMQDVPAQYWGFMLSPKEKFSDEAKELAKDALAGKFPKKEQR